MLFIPGVFFKQEICPGLYDLVARFGQLCIKATPEDPLRRAQLNKIRHVRKVTCKELAYVATLRVEGLNVCCKTFLELLVATVCKLWKELSATKVQVYKGHILKTGCYRHIWHKIPFPV